MNQGYVTYEDFGAVGDGVVCDIEAIFKAHEYANANGLPVKARDGAKYYIDGRLLTVKVMTDTDFGLAEFVIDDTAPAEPEADVFEVVSAFERFTPEIKDLRAGQTRVDFPHEGNVYVRVFNSERKIFIRKGLNANAGTDSCDCFTVDAEGNVVGDITWDYEKITESYAFRIDDEPIVIKGGKFTTIANRHEPVSLYHYRGINVYRANVTIEGLTHYVIGEGDHGAPYSHFISGKETANLTIKNCLMTPRKTYIRPSEADPTKTVSMGTYDLNFTAVVGVNLIGIKQTRNIHDKVYWGLMGSNFCKNMYLADCEMSRFDAHMGVSGVTLKNCVFGHQRVNLIGFGDAYLENVTSTGVSFCSLRNDYGAIWRGNLTIKNCTWIPEDCSGHLTVIRAHNNQDHDFGYVCSMPENIVIDGLRVIDGDVPKEIPFYILPDYDSTFSKDKPHRYVTSKRLTVSDLKTESGREWKPFARGELYEKIIID